ncbi:MAG: glycosyltransferase, partial [Candidatus Methylumidiphilus sp.]
HMESSPNNDRDEGCGEGRNLPPDSLREMGQRGRVYVEQNFGWPGIAEQMLSVYRWVLGQGEKPDCIMTD